MNRFPIVCLAAFAAAGALAAKPRLAPNGQPIVQKIDKAALQQVQMRQFGGFLKDTRDQAGKVVIVNAQSAADAAWLGEVAAAFDRMVKISVEVAPGSFDLAAPGLQGTASVFVVDDPKLPMSLVAPESKWAMVNVAPLKTAKAAFFEARVKKEVTRAMGYLLGAADSQYPMCLTGCVTKPTDLDQYVQTTKLPLDVIVKMTKYAPGLGIRPYKRTTYRAACTEGWAPQPTNEFQKAIWAEVHKAPTAPIVIKPEPKKAK